MTDQLKSQLQVALAIRDYYSIYNIFVDNRLSFIDLLVFYKVNDETILPDALFWNSQLPHYYLKQVLDSDLKISFIESYFKSNANSNDELNRHLIIICKDDYVRHFKLWRAFEKPQFWDSFKSISDSDQELARVKRELEIVIQSQKRIQLDVQKDEQFFLQFTIGDLLLGFSLYYYEFKQQPEFLNNKSWQTQIEVAVLSELDRVFLLHKGKASMQLGFKNNSGLQEYFTKNEAPHHILGKKTKETSEIKFKKIYHLIEEAIRQTMRRNNIQLYLCGFADFEGINSNNILLKTNDKYRVFQINNAKSTPEELYFSNLRKETMYSKPPSKTDCTSINNALHFYGFPSSVTVNGFEIVIEKVVKLLKYFSVYKGPEERWVISNDKVLIFNKGDEKFIELFGDNESITIFGYDKLIENISIYFDWGKVETTAIISFLTFDLDTANYPLSWVSRPFIKLNEQILWLGSFLKDRRWDNILINKIKQEDEFKSLVNKLSRNFELQIHKLFENNNFKTLSGITFRSSNGQRGDFDLLAFKDNYLFIGEAKCGSRSDDFYHAVYLETVRLEGCAAEQLDKSVFNIQEDWKTIKTKLEIPDNVNLEEVTIIPMVMTDYFEGDLQLYKEKYRKISLLELDVLFKNKKKDLLEVYILKKLTSDRNNPNIRSPSSREKNWDLWLGNNYPDIRILLKNIDNNEIWKEIEDVWNFPDVAFTIE